MAHRTQLKDGRTALRRRPHLAACVSASSDSRLCEDDEVGAGSWVGRRLLQRGCSVSRAWIGGALRKPAQYRVIKRNGRRTGGCINDDDEPSTEYAALTRASWKAGRADGGARGPEVFDDDITAVSARSSSPLQWFGGKSSGTVSRR